MLLIIKFSRICKHSQNVLDYMEVRVKFSLITPEISENFPSKYLGYTVYHSRISFSLKLEYNSIIADL